MILEWERTFSRQKKYLLVLLMFNRYEVVSKRNGPIMYTDLETDKTFLLFPVSSLEV